MYHDSFLWSLWGFPSSPAYLFLHATACGLRRTSTSSPNRMLLCCLRRPLKPSASAIAVSKLYQHFRERGLPCGLQDSLPTLSPSRSVLQLVQWGEPSAVYTFIWAAARFQTICRY